MYFYLKLTDPGPKGQEGWNFSYRDLNRDALIARLDGFKEAHPHISLEYTILEANEISDTDLLAQVKDRTKYNSVYGRDSVLLRGMHCHYNFERCGEYILKKEKDLQKEFTTLVYIRPDLLFTKGCNPIESYSESVVTLGTGPNHVNNDHIAIIPRKHFAPFFFERMNVYRTNTTKMFGQPEEVYWHTIPYEVRGIGGYSIKRAG